MKSYHREALAGMAVLGASGFVSAVALLFLASNRIDGIPPDVVAALLLAVQYHLIGLTLAKFGMDYAVFAIVTKNRALTFHARDALLVPILPCTLLFGAASYLLFSPLAAFYLTAAVLLDTLATIHSAELNARRKFVESAIGNFLNYPVFVILWAVLAFRSEATLEQGLSVFLITRALRYFWIASRVRRGALDGEAAMLTMKGWIGMQGGLNLLAFRSDQLLVAIVLFMGVAWVGESRDLNLFVFLCRFPEVATGIIVLIGTVIFPKRHLNQNPIATSQDVLWRYLLVSLLIAIAGAVALVLCSPLYVGDPPSVRWWLPYVAHVALILPANLIIYSMQSQGFLGGLLRNYTIGIALGAAVGLYAVATKSMLVMAWIVPVQLSVFFAVSVFASWGRSSVAYQTLGERQT